MSTQPLINTPSATTVLQKVTLRETQNESDTLSPSCLVHFFPIPIMTYNIFTLVFFGKHIVFTGQITKKEAVQIESGMQKP